MQAEPGFAAFAAAYDAGRPTVVWTTLVADLETPVSAMLKLAEARPNSFLFESVEGGATRGRYSLIGLKPDLIWRCRGDRAEINRRARSAADAFAPSPYARPRDRRADVVADFGRSLPHERGGGAPGELPEPTSNMSRDAFHAMVRKAKEYILAGDIFQVVPSPRFAVPFRLPPFALYRALRRLNPPPVLFFLDFGDFAVG